jgi:hypothetical protein
MPDDRVVYNLDKQNRVTVFRGLWQVTTALRFVKRQIEREGGDGVVLQQLHVSEAGEAEWRDVPMVRADG